MVEMTAQMELRLSAQRAFLGRIHPEMRLVKVKFDRDWIVVSVVVDRQPSEKIREDVVEATTEIIADFRSPTKIKEIIEVSVGPLAKEDVFLEGWIFQRSE